MEILKPLTLQTSTQIENCEGYQVVYDSKIMTYHGKIEGVDVFIQHPSMMGIYDQLLLLGQCLPPGSFT